MASIPPLLSQQQAPPRDVVLAAYRASFAERVSEGTIRPLVFPYDYYGFLVLIIYLCISNTGRPRLYAARWGVLAFIVAWEGRLLWGVSSGNMAVAFAVGLSITWSIIWSVVWLVWMKPQEEAMRVERRRKVAGENGVLLRDREQQNGSAADERKEASNGTAIGAASELQNGAVTNVDHSKYYWQSYPSNLGQRVSWVLDLLLNFRGPGWNWAIPPLPSLPAQVQYELGSSTSSALSASISSTGLQRFSTRRDLFLNRITRVLIGCLLLDFVKTVIGTDPYFTFGPNTYALPPHLDKLSLLVLNLYRQVLMLCGIISALEAVFALVSIFNTCVLGPRVLGLRGEPWYYATTWGSISIISRKGLNGLWGSWWHQTFRMAFSAPTNYLITHGYIQARSKTTKSLSLFFAFAISGFMHAGGSMTQLGPSRPWSPPAFFMLQALGVFLQSSIASLLHVYIARLPAPVRHAGNWVFTLAWMFGTAPLLLDDLSRGGVWLFEPVPVSLLRGLGYGAAHEGAWCWQYEVRDWYWYKGEHWWESGIAL